MVSISAPDDLVKLKKEFKMNGFVGGREYWLFF